MNGIKIRGLGHCVPEHVVTNDDLAQRMDTSDEWITTRTGIRRRHHVTGETVPEMCISAAKTALERSGVQAEDIGACIVATMSPQNLMPSTACAIQKALGLPGDVLCFDLNAACSGFLYAMHTMECLLAAAPRKFGLVVGGEALSRIVDWEDRSTCILFGDGAGAAVVESREAWPSIGAVIGCDGNEEILHAAGPSSGEKPLIGMEGAKVFRFAVDTLPRCIAQLLEKHGMGIDDVDQFVFHQANARIIDSVARKCGIPAEKCYKDLHEYGNTSAASIPMALSEMAEQGLVGPGTRAVILGFGGGLTWGGALVEFA